MNTLNQAHGEDWVAYHGDCCNVMAGLPDNMIGYSIYSVPFANLYVYSASSHDFGNCKNDDEFFGQMAFMIRELYRITKPGRLTSIHCMNLPCSKVNHGYIGLRDFRGQIIRAFEAEGWLFHSEVCIWKDPVVAMQRTKAIGLLHKQLCKDSTVSRQGIPDYLVTMRKPGENAERVSGEFDEYFGQAGTGPSANNSPTRYSIETWQRYASPVWMDIDQSDTLQYRSAREQEDEKHICPLQLQVIERGLALWSNPGDIVLSPFMGIGSEGWVSIQHGRKFVGIELKESYWKQAVANLQIAEANKKSSLLL